MVRESHIIGGSDGAAAMTFHETGQSLAEIERDYILETLAQCGGNRTHTARVLKISLRSLRMKLQDYSLRGFEITAAGQIGETSV
jgi:DNA-binding NtrC family response regulator